MKGRKPIPTAIKKIRGNTGHRPLNKFEPLPVRCIPEKPPAMNKLEKEVWNYLSGVLDRMNVLTEADMFTLMNLCGIVSQIILLKKAVDKEGTVQTIQKVDALGNEIKESKENPKTKQLHRLWSEYRYYSGLFGLDPSSRVRLKTNEAPPGGEIGEFFEKK